MNITLLKQYAVPILSAGTVLVVGTGVWVFTVVQPNRLAGIGAQPSAVVTSPSSTVTPSATSTVTQPTATPTPVTATCKFLFIDPSVTITSPCNGQKATKGFTFKATVPNIYAGITSKSDVAAYTIEIKDGKGNRISLRNLGLGTTSSDGKTITYNMPIPYFLASKTSHATVYFYLDNPRKDLAQIDIVVK